METDESQALIPFQLQFDKPIPSQITIAEWNPEKDLLAMVTEDSKILLHRFNWQRLWTIVPGKSITSICWRPDGKAIAVGLEDGTVSLYDVENGKLLRSLKSHTIAIVSLNWEEDGHIDSDGFEKVSAYEDRTSRFFPPAPRAPRIPGVVSGDSSFLDDGEDSLRELSNSSDQRFNILCSGDKDGNVCFSVFGIFPIGKINIHDIGVPGPYADEHEIYQLKNASIYKVSLSKDLCRLIVICSGKVEVESRVRQVNSQGMEGLHCLVLNTSIFWKRKNELYQVALQASNIKDLTEVIRASVSVMSKQWADAMKIFHDKFKPLSTLIMDHDLDSSPQEELLSLLGGARTSPALHQFLVNSLGEAGVKRAAKVVCGTGKELLALVLDHLQPAAEIIGFRMGELRGLSKWRARFQSIGLNEELLNSATEKSGMLLVQVERLMRVLSSVMLQFSNFFNWLLKCIKLLMQEPGDQILQYNSELVVVFLKFLYDQDPVGQLLELSEVENPIEVDLETMQRVKDLVPFGGFSDCDYLRRTLAKEFQQVESSFKDALLMPFTTISQKILCEDITSLFPLPSSTVSRSITIPLSVSYYKDACEDGLSLQKGFVDYISFQIADGSLPDVANCVGIIRGFTQNSSTVKKGYTSLEAILLSIPDSYRCVDLSLYKESQIVLLLNESSMESESSENACLMMVQTSELPFVSISTTTSLDYWELNRLKDSIVYLQMENEKVRRIPHSVIPPFAVSTSRGVACIYSARKRALVYILEEDEDEVSESE